MALDRNSTVRPLDVARVTESTGQSTNLCHRGVEFEIPEIEFGSVVTVKILALSVFGILLARVRRSSRLLKIVFPLLSPLSSFSSTEGESLR